MTQVLVTGGAGYIGSHMCIELLHAGYDVVALDNLSNSSRESLTCVQSIAGKPLEFVEIDLRDSASLARLFASHSFDAVFHFAGLKAVGESVKQPLLYYDNNVHGTNELLVAMQQAGVKTIVFSSSATVYGIPDDMPISEDLATEPINPYGRSKLFIEAILKDIHASEPGWRISLLRYFNPVGAHPSGKVGENPKGTPNNLMPIISQVAVGNLPFLTIYGDDYDTPDGTGIRDYIHVVDLVRGHLHALDFVNRNPMLATHNLGTGSGYSVLEVLRAFERASGKSIPFKIEARRAGDAAVSYADPAKAARELNWVAEYDIDRMCEDVWRWQNANPDGYSNG